MKRSRLVFWSVSGVIILGGVGGLLWLKHYVETPASLPAPFSLSDETRKTADQPPEPWTPPNAWWKTVTLDAYDRVNAKTLWPCGRRAVTAFAADLAGGPTRTDDERQDATQASSRAMDFGPTDPLLKYIWARTHHNQDDRDGRIAIGDLVQAAVDLRDTKEYPAFIRALALCEAASVTAKSRPMLSAKSTPDVRSSTPQKLMSDAAVLWPEVTADRAMPWPALMLLVNHINDACDQLADDRMATVQPLLKALQKAHQPAGVVQTIRGAALLRYAADARKTKDGESPTDQATQQAAQRLADARTALSEAWEADHTNSVAAELMVSVCAAEQRDPAEIDTWFRRALTADPGNESVCRSRMRLVGSKSAGGVAPAVAFAKELSTASSDPRAIRIPLVLVDAHWECAEWEGAGIPASSYFDAHPEAWDDIRRVYDNYLAKSPSRLHRTRYALIAGWLGKWEVASQQFALLGDRYCNTLVDERVLKKVRARATREAGATAKSSS